MINAIVGRPRSGKSFEAVVFHIIPAVKSGRKIITNIPLNVEWFVSVYGQAAADLLEVRVYDFSDYGQVRPFSTPAEYLDTWRNDQGQGALYVVDECHLSLPVGRTLPPVLEWYSMHGHYGVDILLLTQSLNKVHRDIRDMVQIVYSTSKNTALGSDSTYVKKVRDGYRGEVLNEEIRKYKKEYFSAYKSHTQSKTAVAEAAASDIKPIWKHWSFRGAALCFVVAAGMMINLALGSDPEPEKQPQARLIFPSDKKPDNPPVTARPVAVSQVVPGVEPEKEPELKHPYSDYDLHIKARIFGMNNGKLKDVLLLIVSQNGQPVFSITGVDLVKAGYKYNLLNDCLLELKFDSKFVGYKTCDLPQIGLMAGR